MQSKTNHNIFSVHSNLINTLRLQVSLLHFSDVRHIANEAHQEVHGDCETEAKGEFIHSHAHGNGGHHHHGNKVPGSVAAVAWMVIMGDGVHNFSDGLAIGNCVFIKIVFKSITLKTKYIS